jgi:hypothetical protein
MTSSGQTGTYYTGDTWASAFSNGGMSSRTTTDTGANDHTWQTRGHQNVTRHASAAANSTKFATTMSA